MVHVDSLPPLQFVVRVVEVAAIVVVHPGVAAVHLQEEEGDNHIKIVGD